MDDEELLKQFEFIRKSLTDLNKLLLLIATEFYSVEDYSEEGRLEKSIPTELLEKKPRSYLG